MNKFERLQAKIKGYNKGSYYKMRLKDIGDEFSIYFELRRDGIRDIKYPKLHISGNGTPTRADLEAVERAREKQQYFDELYKNQDLDSLNNLTKKKSKVIPFFESRRDSHKEKNTRKAWNNAIKHFREYAGEGITFQDINNDFCNEFRSYLQTKVNDYTTCTYFSIFKRMLNIATAKGIYIISPAHQIRNVKPETNRDFLTLEELRKLKDTEMLEKRKTMSPDVIRAFLFACYTGLRISDIINLKWENVVDKDFLNIKVTKTKRFLKNKLNETAKDILDEQKSEYPEREYIFRLPKGGNNINLHLKRWTEQAGITKHVTFHTARHTAACLSISGGNSLFATSKILGHSATKTTEIYAKLIDEEKYKAMDNFPKL